MKIRNICYGYHYADGKIAVDENEANIVSDIFKSYLGGMSLQQISQQLTNNQVEFISGIVNWNKSKVKRILENNCYIGADNYPPIVDKRTFLAVQNIKSNKNTQKSTDKTSDIYRITSLVRYHENGCPMKRIYDGRNPKNTKWQCIGTDCNFNFRIQDDELLDRIVNILNRLIKAPEIMSYNSETFEPSNNAKKSENIIYHLLDKAVINEDEVIRLIFESASIKYSELQNTEYITEKLKAKFEKTDLLSAFSMELFSQTVNTIEFHTDHTISLLMKNNQRVGEC